MASIELGQEPCTDPRRRVVGIADLLRLNLVFLQLGAAVHPIYDTISECITKRISQHRGRVDLAAEGTTHQRARRAGGELGHELTRRSWRAERVPCLGGDRCRHRRDRHVASHLMDRAVRASCPRPVTLRQKRRFA
jgi:hypothetical protein